MSLVSAPVDAGSREGTAAEPAEVVLVGLPASGAEGHEGGAGAVTAAESETIVRTSAARREFGVKVRNGRAALGISQADLAMDAGCLRHHIEQIEAGACYLPGVLRRVAEVLGI